MKSLLKIVTLSIILVLFLILFNQTNNFKQPAKPLPIAEQQEQTATLPKSEFSNKNCQCKSECLCFDDEPDCTCNKTKTVCTCTKENGETVTMESIETNNANIEEEYPEQTAQEDESILSN